MGTEEGHVPEWIKRMAEQSLKEGGKVISLDEMRKILSKCGSLSEEIIRERHGDDEKEKPMNKYYTECPVCGLKIETEAESPSSGYKLLTPLRWNHLETVHKDEATKDYEAGILCIYCKKVIGLEGETDAERKISEMKHFKDVHSEIPTSYMDGFPVWEDSGAQVVFPMMKKDDDTLSEVEFPLKGSILKDDSPTEPVAEDEWEAAEEAKSEQERKEQAEKVLKIFDEWEAADANVDEQKIIEKRKQRVRRVQIREVQKLIDRWSKEPVDEETQKIIEKLSKPRTPETVRGCFERFFEEMGVVYRVGDGGKAREFAGHPSRCHPAYASCLHVAQAMFLFDEKGNYMGVMGDEMGFYNPKQ